MREIKFRIWDGKKYIHDGGSDVLSIEASGGGAMRSQFDSCESPVRYLDDCVIEQFTGLLDKTGKEIFEGDIVQDFRKSFKYVCVFRENGAFEFQNMTTLNFSMLHEIWDAELIGNIHDNPDLP